MKVKITKPCSGAPFFLGNDVNDEIEVTKDLGEALIAADKGVEVIAETKPKKETAK